MSRPMSVVRQKGRSLPVLYDRWLLISTLGLIAMGLLMVASASIVISYQLYGIPFHYVFHQLIYLGVGTMLAMLVMRTEMEFWQEISSFLLLVSFALLILVLIPGIGREVNGSMRWIGVGPIGMQISELVKLTVIIFMAGYLTRRNEEVRTRISGFIKPMFIVTLIAALLLKQPDFGAVVVILATVMGMMFLSGVQIWPFGALLTGVVGILSIIAISSPYRMARLMTFLDPWAHPFQSGYQLTQSLIAFGRGGWWGVGLGESVQKLFYLPEAHTDFIFAVLAEELGLIGMLTIMTLFSLLVVRAMIIGRAAQRVGEYFSAYVAYGIGLWIGLQGLINIGVNCGALPTKGLTLPFISYGGSSLIVMCLALAILMRVDHESRLLSYGFSKSRRVKK